ncbi:hypothetical protein [Thalassobellus sediminis]|uniref:hypothetical protein n=1 Tax=Thalassobellus sediminis TaxID=3367753 RepID=UPI0037A5BCBA
MKEADKHLENLTKKVMKDTGLESTSFDFTTSVMSQVEALNSSATVYKPLISKTGWSFIIALILALTLYLMLGVETESSSIFSSIDFSIFSNNKITNTLTSYRMPKTFMYAIVLFGVMLCIQIPLLKNYFDKRYES